MIAYVKGSLKKFEAEIETDDVDFETATINLTIDSDSITTGDSKRDEHLKSADFFDVENYPKIIFKGIRMGEAEPGDHHVLSGELTIKGITRSIELNVQFGGMLKDPWGNEKAGFAITGKIDRSDWELTWNTVMDAGGLLVGEEVHISCDVELLRESETKGEGELEPVVYKNIVL